MNMISAYNRDVSRRKALRKRRIAREVCDWEYYDNLHEYSKGKIHCDCCFCSAKTRNKGKRRHKHGNYSPNINYSYRDLKRKMAMDEEETEFDI